jgi:hypothetical protein
MYSIILIVYVYNVLYLYYISYVRIACMFLPIKKKDPVRRSHASPSEAVAAGFLGQPSETTLYTIAMGY